MARRPDNDIHPAEWWLLIAIILLVAFLGMMITHTPERTTVPKPKASDHLTRS